MDYRYEKLVGPHETAEKFNIAVVTFYRMKARLIARGVKTVRVGKPV